MYGVAFKTNENDIFIQFGDGGTPVMESGVFFNLKTKSWDIARINGSVPDIKSEMTATLNQTTNQAWYYGGRSTKNQQAANNFTYYNDFYYLDTTTNTWNWPHIYYSGGIRPARYGHSTNLINGQLFILGGKTAIMNTTDNSWIINIADFQSVLVFDTLTGHSISMATIGDIPEGLARYSTINASDGRSIIMFGGKIADNLSTFIPTNDIHVLDTCTLSWSTPTIHGSPPAARAGHEAVTYGNYMIIIGGITNVSSTTHELTYANDIAILDLTTWTWIQQLPDNIHATSNPVYPGCRFDMPNIPNDNDGNGFNGNGLPYDPTVVSNPYINDNTALKEGLGIGLGLFGLIICGLGIFYILRLRKNAKTFSPRWLPTLFSKRKSTNNSINSSSTVSSSSPPSNDKQENLKNTELPMFVISEHP
ncbi:unnamed protein product [Cunninghamella echinulata]